MASLAGPPLSVAEGAGEAPTPPAQPTVQQDGESQAAPATSEATSVEPPVRRGRGHFQKGMRYGDLQTQAEVEALAAADEATLTAPAQPNDGAELRLQIFQGQVQPRQLAVVYNEAHLVELQPQIQPYSGPIHPHLVKKRLETLKVSTKESYYLCGRMAEVLLPHVGQDIDARFAALENYRGSIRVQARLGAVLLVDAREHNTRPLADLMAAINARECATTFLADVPEDFAAECQRQCATTARLPAATFTFCLRSAGSFEPFLVRADRTAAGFQISDVSSEDISLSWDLLLPSIPPADVQVTLRAVRPPSADDLRAIDMFMETVVFEAGRFKSTDTNFTIERVLESIDTTTGSFGDLTLKSSIVIQHDYDEVEQSWGRREVTLSWSPMRIKAAGALLQLESLLAQACGHVVKRQLSAVRETLAGEGPSFRSPIAGKQFKGRGQPHALTAFTESVTLSASPPDFEVQVVSRPGGASATSASRGGSDHGQRRGPSQAKGQPKRARRPPVKPPPTKPVERPDLEEVFATSPREGRKWFLHDERWAPVRYSDEEDF
eukprot:EG_transcript_6099